MKKIYQILCLFVLVVSCSPEEEEIINNIILPQESSETFTSNISLISGSQVLIDWEISTDSIANNTTYNVIVNDIQKGENIKQSSLTIDASEFKSSENATNVVLEVFIEAITNEISNNYEFTEVVNINADPIGLKINNINASNNNNGYFEINFTKAYDLDEDLVTYDFYINDEIIEKDIRVAESIIYPTDYVYNGYDYVPSSYVTNETISTIFLPYNVSEIGNEETTIKIVAKDNEDGSVETEESFSLNATDEDLGTIILSTSQTINFPTNQDEIDNLIRMPFEITEEGLFRFSTTATVNYRIIDSNNLTHSSSYSYGGNEFITGTIEPGNYILELSDFGYSNNEVETIEALFVDPNETDQDLGVVTLPFSEEYELNFVDELDNTIEYSFEITETSGYIINLDSNSYYYSLTLLDENDNQIGYDSDYIWSNEYILEPGIYTIKIKDTYDYSDNSTTLRILLQSSTNTNEDLGTLSLPYSNSIDFEYFLEPDQSIEYTFEVTESTGYNFSSTEDDLDFTLKDRFGNTIKSGYNGQLRSNGDIIVPGNYILEVTPDYYYYTYYNIDNEFTFDIFFNKEDSSDTDLGILNNPSNTLFEFNFGEELDDTIEYTFTVEVESNYLISTNYANIYITLKDVDSTSYYDYIQRGSKGISSEYYYETLAPGTYIIELEDNGTNTRGDLLIEISE